MSILYIQPSFSCVVEEVANKESIRSFLTENYRALSDTIEFIEFEQKVPLHEKIRNHFAKKMDPKKCISTKLYHEIKTFVEFTNDEYQWCHAKVVAKSYNRNKLKYLHCE
tara:strand:+ start:1700 stop:2029 length:330 start_codon:yes stop_codon:yes gene_type:complete